MRVLAVIDTLVLGGGAERLLVSLAIALRDRGIEVETVALFNVQHDIGAELESRGLKFHRLGLAGHFDFLGSRRRLRALLNGGRFDFVWAHLQLGSLHSLAALRGLAASTARPVLMLHGHKLDPGILHPRALVLSRILGLLGAPADVLKVAVSNAVARDHENIFGWRSVTTILNGIPLKGLDPEAPGLQAGVLRQSVGVPDGAFLIVIPSRFSPEKGHDVLLHALAQLGPQFFCVALGQGHWRRHLERLAGRIGVASRVHFHDAVTQPSLFDWMRSADVVVLPSRREPFGLAAAEAMALGRPVVLSRVDGFIELVGDSGAVLWVEPGNVESLAAALSRVRSEPWLREDLRQRGMQRVRTCFTIEACADRWMSFFREAMGTPRAGA